MSQLPVKFRVVQMIFQKEGFSNQEIFELLKKEYPRDRSVNEEGIDNYLLSLKAVGLIKIVSASSDKNGKLKQCYTITDYGTSRMKYVGQY
ncbi:hypothetical protein E4K67_00325 [Desulfosporosinus fructosivorans]|uniref:DUF4364 family protein n=1 Tax=Desulfosporosinus fructosivorans TaxID=2018669 RepID=A0A4Z0RBF2_9FIRM|nr:hypothetical protein [Desulfosporosinus fructosivorans]TGE39497.1 hypothetical protein E4K67_00325 [Desulfosporosinus fructosivorans]